MGCYQCFVLCNSHDHTAREGPDAWFQFCFHLSSSCARTVDEVAKAAQFQAHRVALGHCKTVVEQKSVVQGQTPERLAQQIL